MSMFGRRILASRGSELMSHAALEQGVGIDRHASQCQCQSGTRFAIRNQTGPWKHRRDDGEEAEKEHGARAASERTRRGEPRKSRFASPSRLR